MQKFDWAYFGVTYCELCDTVSEWLYCESCDDTEHCGLCGESDNCEITLEVN